MKTNQSVEKKSKVDQQGTKKYCALCNSEHFRENSSFCSRECEGVAIEGYSLQNERDAGFTISSFSYPY